MHLVQLTLPNGERAVAAVEDGTVRRVRGATTNYALAALAVATDRSLLQTVREFGLGETLDLDDAAAQGRLLAPLDHADPAHFLVTGTGLTHLGSAEQRDRMHKDSVPSEVLTDSMKMFQAGVKGGKPAAGQTGVQPEWFYKGDGGIVVAPGQKLASPSFALDGGEEPEIVGLYYIGPGGTPFRLGFALGNEFSDHVTERQSYLYLGHSKLRPCSFGPELLLGDLPADIRGVSRITRQGVTIWEKPFLSGEANMCHSLRNLEAHLFKYPQFRRPGDIHAHFLGTATVSFGDGIRVEPYDTFEIGASPFTRTLKNTLTIDQAVTPEVKSL
jgi:hypothetical protein